VRKRVLERLQLVHKAFLRRIETRKKIKWAMGRDSGLETQWGSEPSFNDSDSDPSSNSDSFSDDTDSSDSSSHSSDSPSHSSDSSSHSSDSSSHSSDSSSDSRNSFTDSDSSSDSSSDSETDAETDSAETESEEMGEVNLDRDTDTDSLSEDFKLKQRARKLQYLILKISKIRYWESRRIEDRRAKALTIHTWFHQPWFDVPRVFRAFFRMDHNSFEGLLARIENHPVFFNNSRGAQQTPVFYQLAVFLYRLGAKGMGDTELHSATALGIGEGSIRNFTARVLTAILSLREEMIKWPTAEEKAAMKQRICAASRGVFPNCVGFIDGTFIMLLYAPLQDWYFYFNRKSSYALNALVVCTDQYRITFVRAGETSAVHDATVFENSHLALHPATFFENGEYLIGDSAYSVNDYMIAPFKMPRGDAAVCKQFNSTLSSQRIAIEHTFGQLKARFPSITAVSTRISGLKGHKAVVDWFEAACILHNLLLTTDELAWDSTEDLNMAKEHQKLVEEAAAAETARAEQEAAEAEAARRAAQEALGRRVRRRRAPPKKKRPSTRNTFELYGRPPFVNTEQLPDKTSLQSPAPLLPSPLLVAPLLLTESRPAAPPHLQHLAAAAPLHS
jgi:hypothetical protein